MSPYEIQVLFHYYVCAEDHPDINRNPPIWRPTIEKFQRENLIETSMERKDTRLYRLTQRGDVFCKFITQLSLPRPAWKMVIEEVIEPDV